MSATFVALHSLAEFLVGAANRSLPADVGSFRVAREGQGLCLSFVWLRGEYVPAVELITIDRDYDPCGYGDAVVECMPWTIHGADAPWTKWGGDTIINTLTSAGARLGRSGGCDGEDFVSLALP